MMNNFQTTAQTVLNALRESGFEEEATTVGRLADAARMPEAAEMAIIELATMCHVKYLGRLNVNDDCWLTMLAKLRSAASAEFIDIYGSNPAIVPR